MTARAMEPAAIHEFIFGDPELHERFSTAIELLVRIAVSRKPAITTGELAEALGQPPRVIRGLLVTLHGSGLLCPADDGKDTWRCSAGLGTITLADIFRSIVGNLPDTARKKKSDGGDEMRTASQQNVELLLMQATMAINQVVLQHLQAFDLGKLKALESGGRFPRFDSSARSYIAEPA